MLVIRPILDRSPAEPFHLRLQLVREACDCARSALNYSLGLWERPQAIEHMTLSVPSLFGGYCQQGWRMKVSFLRTELAKK